MFPLIFSVLWTLGCALLIFSNFDQLGPLERPVAILFLLAGAFFVHTTWRQWRRRRSLRVETHGDSTWYVWVEFDGSTKRSTRDPREDWDSDGDGGDGGDGGGD